MNKKNVLQDKFVEEYLRMLVAELPGSSSALWYRVGGRAQFDDTKLLRILRASKKGNMFRYCSQIQQAILFLSVGGRVFIPSKRKEFKEVIEDGKTRVLTRREIAEYLGISLSEFKREMTMARYNLQRAIDEYYDRGDDNRLCAIC